MSEVRQRIYEAKRDALNRQVDLLLQDYQAVIAQQSHTLNEADKMRLQRQADTLNQQMDNIADQLDALEQDNHQVARTDSAHDYNRRYLALQSKLPRIDFKSLEPTLRRLLAPSEHACAALLLLQNSYTMGGTYCMARLRELLQGETLDFKYWPVGFDPRGRTDELAVLQGLAGYMNLDPQPDQSLPDYSQAVIETMMGSLQSGSIIFIELKKWEYLTPGPQVLEWFMGFWQDTVNALAATTRQLHQVKIFALIIADPPLPQQHLKAEHQCSARQFDNTKILELRLKKWTLREIQEWMGAYSGLPAPQIDRIAHKIHGATQGLPSAVARALLEECCPDAAR